MERVHAHDKGKNTVPCKIMLHPNMNIKQEDQESKATTNTLSIDESHSTERAFRKGKNFATARISHHDIRVTLWQEGQAVAKAL